MVEGWSVEPSQTSKIELFGKIIDCIQPFTIIVKRFILDISKVYDSTSDKTK